MAQIEMTNAQVLDAVAALKELVDTPLPVAGSLKVVRMARALEAAAGDVATVRQKLVDRYVERDAAGAPLPALDAEGNEIAGHVRVSDAAAFAREAEELMQARLQVAAEPLATAELGAALSVSPRVLLMLGPLLRLEEEAPAEA